MRNGSNRNKRRHLSTTSSGSHPSVMALLSECLELLLMHNGYNGDDYDDAMKKKQTYLR